MKKTTEQFAQELKQRYNLTLLSEYLGAHKPIEFLCENNHKNIGMATNVLQRGYKCKECLHGRTIESKLEWNATTLAKLQELVDQLVSTEDIAKYFKTTKSAIDNACFKFKITRDRTKATEKQLLSILALQNRVLLSSFQTVKDLVTIKCSHGHIAEQTAGNIIYKNTGCPQCFHAIGKSQKELELVEFIKQNYQGWIELSDRSILDGRELDIVLPDLGLAIEYNGSYWHSQAKVTKYYHQQKTNDVEQFGYQLIHVYEHNNLNIVKSRLLQKLKKSQKIYARNCVIKSIQFPKEFLEQTHLQGAGAPTKVNYGLFYKDELVACMTFAPSRFNKDFEYELVRYSSALNTTVVGGASKLFKHANLQSVVSYCARDWSQGQLYKQLGFKLLYSTEPNYCYTNHMEHKTRYQCQKQLLAKWLKDYDPQLTEEQNMQNNNWLKVYDSGNLVFGFTK